MAQKYARLTKEQFEELHKEFINFLATQSISAEEWKSLKKNKPEVAEQELDIFSDLVWEGVLEKAEYLENIAPQQLFLFKMEGSQMRVIGLKILDKSKDITTPDGYGWLQENFATDVVEFVVGKKEYSNDPKSDIFKLIQEGAIITKGELFTFFEDIIEGNA